MSDSKSSSSVWQNIVAMVVAVLISGLIAVFFLTDIPTRYGLTNSTPGQPKTNAPHAGHDHDSDDHAGHNHGEGDHDAHHHGKHDSDGHDESDVDHSGHDHDADDHDADGVTEHLERNHDTAHDHEDTAHDHTAHDHTSDDHSEHTHSEGDDDHLDNGGLPPFMLSNDAVSISNDQSAVDLHSHDDHDENSIDLTDQARKNLRLVVEPVAIGSFSQHIEVPGVVSDWPGRTHIEVTSPLTGIISAIEIARGELVSNNTPLFSLRLTHQDLVKTQETYLAQLGQRDVEDREITRLTEVSRSGAIAAKSLLARKYERAKLMANIGAARQSLLLHGLTETQINHIDTTRELIREVTVRVPEVHEDDSLHHDSLSHHGQTGQVHLAAHKHGGGDHPEHVSVDFLVTTLDVNRGQSVMAGERLTRLSDYSNLLIEGHAFQRDGDALRQAAESKLPLQAVLDSTGSAPTVVGDLQIVNIGSEINRKSRSLPFYVGLKNEIERSELRDEKRYASWKYKPGQRLRVRIPTQQIDNVIVVPADAVAKEGLERYVFVEGPGHFDRVPVTVVAEDSLHIAISKDENLRPGQMIAIVGAHQLQMAMKNKNAPAASHTHDHAH